jgi:hypothetical protein
MIMPLLFAASPELLPGRSPSPSQKFAMVREKTQGTARDLSRMAQILGIALACGVHLRLDPCCGR